MKHSDVVLISPPQYLSQNKDNITSLGGFEHLGLGYLAASLERANNSVEIFIVESSNMTPSEVVLKTMELTPYLIGISPTSHSMEWTESFCQLCKKNANTIIAIGGHLATHMGKQILEDNENVDIICAYDGEKTICELTYNIKSGIYDFKNINNLIYRNEKGDIITQIENIPNDLDQLPWPKRCFLGSGSARMLISRGCAYACNFCTTPDFYHRKIRYRDVADVIEEMIELKKNYNVARFFFTDDSFVDNSNKSIQYVEDFISSISKHLPTIEFRCEIRADVIVENQNLIKKLYDAGMKYLFVGFESCIESELNELNKRIDLATIKSVPNILSQIGISVVPGFIMYNQNTTLNDLKKKIDFLYMNNYLYRTTTFTRTCLGYPGSMYYKNMKQEKTYDEYRSNKYLLYPNFEDSRIRILSTAFEEIEYMYLKPDSIMLNSVVYFYDKYVLRKTTHTETAGGLLNQATQTLKSIQDAYYALYLESLEIAKLEKDATICIIALFEQQLDLIQSKVDLFLSLVDKVDRSASI